VTDIPTTPLPTRDGSSSALPETAPRWTIATTAGHTATGYLPPWAAKNPSEKDVPIERLGAHLSDITHYTEFEGQTVLVHSSERKGEGPADEQILYGSIDCHPYAEDPDPRIPVVNINISNGCWTTDLDPAGLAAFIAAFRAQADRLDREVLPALIAAREDWDAHHG
jgi:hypothetical protein